MPSHAATVCYGFERFSCRDCSTLPARKQLFRCTVSPKTKVRAYIKLTNCSSQTLAAFLKEAGLPANAGSFDAGSLTIEQILREKKLYDLTANFEKTALNGSNQGWTLLGMQSEKRTNEQR